MYGTLVPPLVTGKRFSPKIEPYNVGRYFTAVEWRPLMFQGYGYIVASDC